MMIDLNQILQTLDHYSEPLLKWGPIAIFVLLGMGIILLPIPEETLLLTSGFLIAKGKLLAAETFIAATLGSMCGITVSYSLGRTLGHYLITRFGHWFKLTPQKINKVEYWFARFGSWTLWIGYYIPGLRHLIGYVAGTLELPYRRFALFAYCGAFMWVSTFMTVGYLIGRNVLK